MFPSFVLFGKEISLYALMALTGYLLAGVVICTIAKKKAMDENMVIQFFLICTVGVFLGGHLLYGITNLHMIYQVFFVLENPDGLWSILQKIVLIFGGSVFYGGLLGGIGTGFWYARRKKLSLGEYADLAAVGIPLFHGFGRIGCFLGGCCYGIECPVGFVFQNSLVEAANGVSRFPVQLVEAGFEFLLFGLLLWMTGKGLQKNNRIFWYLGLYAVGRFLLEFLRGDVIRGFVGGLSTSQWISLALLAGIVIIKISRRKVVAE